MITPNLFAPYSSDPVSDAAAHLDAAARRADALDKEKDRLKAEFLDLAMNAKHSAVIFSRMRSVIDSSDREGQRVETYVFRALITACRKRDISAIRAVEIMAEVYAEENAEVSE